MNQSLALSILKSGRNVFLTGQAGAGKTYVINQYIRRLRSCDIAVAITASTGIAATHIG
jgi:tRNA A37 threonylcarbamoyladenosine biosynthesis protein TsaE